MSSAGQKRRSRFSTASSAIMNPNTAEAQGGNEASSSNAPSSGSTTTSDVPMQDREKRGSRMFNQIRDGFRRSASSRSVAPLAGSKMPLDAVATGQATTDMVVDQSEGPPEQTGTVVAADGIRQDKKRRRIGEYARPSEDMDDGVGASSLDASKSSVISATVLQLICEFARLCRTSRIHQKLTVKDRITATPLTRPRTPHRFRPSSRRPLTNR